MIAATASRATCGTVAKMLSMRWTRQRCHAVPVSPVLTAGFNPSYAAETTSCPLQASLHQAAQERGSEGPAFGGADLNAKDLALALAGDAHGDQRAEVAADPRDLRLRHTVEPRRLHKILGIPR